MKTNILSRLIHTILFIVYMMITAPFYFPVLIIWGNKGCETIEKPMAYLIDRME